MPVAPSSPFVLPFSSGFSRRITVVASQQAAFNKADVAELNSSL